MSEVFHTNLNIAECLYALGIKKMLHYSRKPICLKNIHAVGNDIYRVAAFSSAYSKTKIVTILIRRSLKLNILNKKGYNLDGIVIYTHKEFAMCYSSSNPFS